MTGIAPSGQRNELIRADSIWKFFGNVTVLKGVDLVLEAGQMPCRQPVALMWLFVPTSTASLTISLQAASPFF